MVYLYYISCLRYTILFGNPRYKTLKTVCVQIIMLKHPTKHKKIPIKTHILYQRTQKQPQPYKLMMTDRQTDTHTHTHTHACASSSSAFHCTRAHTHTHTHTHNTHTYTNTHKIMTTSYNIFLPKSLPEAYKAMRLLCRFFRLLRPRSCRMRKWKQLRIKLRTRRAYAQRSSANA